jgi:hypothetical protein
VPSVVVKYEEFVSNPASVLRSLDALSPETLKKAEPPFAVDGWHTVSGNPIRFDRTPIVFRSDDEWQDRIDSRTERIVTALTWPALRRYGYTTTRDLGSDARH